MLSACNKPATGNHPPSGAKAHASAKSRAAHGNPVIWERVPQLTYPGGASIPDKLSTGDKNPYITDNSALVLFETKADWQAVVDHTVSCLKPLGYYEFFEDGPPGQPYHWHLYYSPDFQTRIQVFNMANLDSSVRPSASDLLLYEVEMTLSTPSGANMFTMHYKEPENFNTHFRKL